MAYLYLGLTYGGYPYLIRLLIPADRQPEEDLILASVSAGEVLQSFETLRIRRRLCGGPFLCKKPGSGRQHKGGESGE